MLGVLPCSMALIGVCVHLALTIFKLVMMPKFNAKQAITDKEARHNYLAGIPAMFEKMLAKRVLKRGHTAQTDILRRDKLNPNIKEV